MPIPNESFAVYTPTPSTMHENVLCPYSTDILRIYSSVAYVVLSFASLCLLPASPFRLLLHDCQEKMDTVCREMYRAGAVEWSAEAEEKVAFYEEAGYGKVMSDN